MKNMIVFLDTNIILDVLLERQPFIIASEKIWKMVEGQRLEGYLSANSMTDIFYISRKSLGIQGAYDVIRKLIHVFGIVTISIAEIREALTYGVQDFEDSLQLVCAERIHADFLITNIQKSFYAFMGKPYFFHCHIT